MTPYARTLTQITDDTLRLCRDFRGTHKNGKIWTWQETLNQVHRSILDMCVRTGILKSIKSLVIKEGTYIYDMPPDCIRLLRASVNGLAGHVVFPKSRGAYDYEGTALTQGDPYTFFRDLLSPSQIGFIPGPGTDGSDFNRDNLYGLLRQIKTPEGDKLPYDYNYALRDIQTLDVSMLRTGDGNIIREVLMPDGNIQVTYVRLPYVPDDPAEYPDADIPEHCHKDVKYGASINLLRPMPDQFSTQKLQYFSTKWESVLRNVQVYAEHKGQLDNVRPV